MSAPYPPGYIPDIPHYQPRPSMSHSTCPPEAGAITTQPGAEPHQTPGSVWIPLPAQIEGVPTGLEYLTMVDTIVIQQIHEIIEIFTDWECSNKYSLRNSNGEQVYYAAENSDALERQCCGSAREFTIHVIDNFKREVIRVSRPSNCMVGWCEDECTVESPPGVVIGSVKQKSSCGVIQLDISDADGRTYFTIEGPCSMGCQDEEFSILDLNGQQAGLITKHWKGLFSEMISDADVFSVSFPLNLDVRLKAVLLGTAFLIVKDFIAFENSK